VRRFRSIFFCHSYFLFRFFGESSTPLGLGRDLNERGYRYLASSPDFFLSAGLPCPLSSCVTTKYYSSQVGLSNSLSVSLRDKEGNESALSGTSKIEFVYSFSLNYFFLIFFVAG